MHRNGCFTGWHPKLWLIVWLLMWWHPSNSESFISSQIHQVEPKYPYVSLWIASIDNHYSYGSVECSGCDITNTSWSSCFEKRADYIRELGKWNHCLLHWILPFTMVSLHLWQVLQMQQIFSMFGTSTKMRSTTANNGFCIAINRAYVRLEWNNQKHQHWKFRGKLFRTWA